MAQASPHRQEPVGRKAPKGRLPPLFSTCRKAQEQPSLHTCPILLLRLFQPAAMATS